MGLSGLFARPVAENGLAAVDDSEMPTGGSSIDPVVVRTLSPQDAGHSALWCMGLDDGHGDAWCRRTAVWHGLSGAETAAGDSRWVCAGPPVPLAPEVVARDRAGTTIRPVRIAQPVRVDGILDEPVYAETPAISNFTQIEPRNGEAASQETEIWLLFDDTEVYVSARVWESELDRMVATEMRHDAGATLAQNELITVVLDTFYDRRNAYVFAINPLGGRIEGQASNEVQFNGDWNGIWEATVGRFAGGWTIEMAIPFKTLRYQSDDSQVWGFQVQRINRWKHEVSFLAPSDPARGPSGFMLASLYATVVGVEAPPPAMNLDIKPYVVSNVTTDRVATPLRLNDADADIGVDVKYGVTDGLVADFTYNTDFAQVEEDEQQVNLTRFSLFFPEKREFFLENQGTFAFGGAETGPTPSGMRPSCSTAVASVCRAPGRCRFRPAADSRAESARSRSVC